MSNSGSARRARAALRDRRGVAALEFALVGGLFCIMLLAAVEVGRYYMTLQGMRNFIADAGRWGMVNMASGQTLCRGALVTAMGRGGTVGGLASSTPGVCVNRTEATVGGGGTRITVTVTTDVNLRVMLNVFGIGDQRFQDTTTVSFLY